ncbi:MAG: hypothetical protein P8169_08230 [Chloroflexota bacterium]
MKKVMLLILLIVIFAGAGVVSADPYKNPTAVVLASVTCDDGFSGDVVVPAFGSGPGGGPAGFFQGEFGGIGRPRSYTITVFGEVVEQWSQPGEGYETVYCFYQDGPALVELQIQRFNYSGIGG